jgi:hypothetical protein
MTIKFVSRSSLSRIGQLDAANKQTPGVVIRRIRCVVKRNRRQIYIHEIVINTTVLLSLVICFLSLNRRHNCRLTL